MVLYLKPHSSLLKEIEEFLDMTLPLGEILFEVDAIFAAKVFKTFVPYKVTLAQLTKLGDSVKGRLVLKPELADYLDEEDLMEAVRTICAGNATAPFIWNSAQKSNLTRFKAKEFMTEDEAKNLKHSPVKKRKDNRKQDTIEDKLVKILSMYPRDKRLPDIKELNEYHLEEYLNLTEVKMDDIRLALLNYHLMIERIEELLNAEAIAQSIETVLGGKFAKYTIPNTFGIKYSTDVDPHEEPHEFINEEETYLEDE
jgi:hypothetical protein